ncbi:unnamed protein product, partial [Rotaria sp. Silwood1]
GEKEGTDVIGINCGGNLSKPLGEPTGLAFDQKGNLYVADSAFGRILKFEINNN